MTIEIGFTSELTNSQFAPLAALYLHYIHKCTLAPLTAVDIPMRGRDFTSADKLIQILLSILSDCETLSKVNNKLKPEVGLAAVCGWKRFADQSNLSRTLDALTEQNIVQLRQANNQIRQAHSAIGQHDWRSYLWLDYDLSGLPCSPSAQESKPGYFSEQKGITGRQLARVSAIDYRETIWSDVYPGNRLTVQCLEAAVEATESALELSSDQCKRTVWRLDGGSGSDDRLRWLLQRGYHVSAKGISNRRAEALAKQVSRWDPYQDVWLGEVTQPVDFGRPVRFIIKRRLKDGSFVHSYYVSTLSFPSKEAFMVQQDARGAAEVEQFRTDKSGLNLEARRKHSFLGQKGYILLTDLAHNLLSDFYRRALKGTPFDGFGPKRIVHDLLATPGRLIFADGQLVRVELLSLKQFSAELAICLEKYCSGD